MRSAKHSPGFAVRSVAAKLVAGPELSQGLARINHKVVARDCRAMDRRRRIALYHDQSERQHDGVGRTDEFADAAVNSAAYKVIPGAREMHISPASHRIGRKLTGALIAARESLLFGVRM